MLNNVLQDLNQTTGIEASLREPPSSEVDALLEIVVDGKSFVLAVVKRSRSPYPGELSWLFDLRDRLGTWGTPTLVAPRMPDSVGNQLVPLGWSWADEQGHYDFRLARGVRLARRQSVPRSRPEPSRRLLPHGRGSLTIIRLLLNVPHDVFLRTSDLASAAGVTAARASQVMHKLQERRLVQKTSDGWSAFRDELLSVFLAEYRGPGGTELHLYSLDDPRDTAAEIVGRTSTSAGGAKPAPIAVSADVGPDLIVPWRRPSKLVAYVDHRANVDLTDFTQAPDRSSANLLVRFPNDRSVFRHHMRTGDLDGIEVPLADETQMIWDLYDLGGEDRAEAARHLCEWLTKSR